MPGSTRSGARRWSRKPEQRYQDAAEFKRDVEAVPAGALITAGWPGRAGSASGSPFPISPGWVPGSGGRCTGMRRL